MKHFLPVLAICICTIGSNLRAQTPILAVSPYEDSLWVIDTSTLAPVGPALQVTSSTGSVSGCNGLSVRPCTGEIYVVYKSGISRYLGILDPSSGYITEVGDMGDNVAGICFGSENHLYAVTGDGASTPETLFKVNISNGTMTNFVTLGGGNDGENIAFCKDNGKIYHWSGLGTQVMEKIDTLTGTITNVPQTGSAHDEVLGSVYIGNGLFILVDLNQDIVPIDTSGFTLPSIGSVDPNNYKGVDFPLSWITASGPVTLCDGDSVTLTCTVAASGYQWYDNGVAITGETTATLTAGTSGDYQCATINGGCTVFSDTIFVDVLNSPVVSITPTPSAVICLPADSVLLTGSSGGSSQWYLNGSPISGATSNTYYATAGGWYNMIKTNANGCSDSSSTGTEVMAGNTPVVTISPSNDTTYCIGDSIELIASVGSAYQWFVNGAPITGGTGSSYFVSSPGIYNVLISDPVGCVDSASAGTRVEEDPCGIGINENGFMETAGLYPVPAREQLVLSAPELSDGSLNMVIRSYDGRELIIRNNLTANGSSMVIDVSSLPSGIYILEIRQKDKRKALRFIKS